MDSKLGLTKDDCLNITNHMKHLYIQNNYNDILVLMNVTTECDNWHDISNTRNMLKNNIKTKVV